MVCISLLTVWLLQTSCLMCIHGARFKLLIMIFFFFFTIIIIITGIEQSYQIHCKSNAFLIGALESSDIL